MTIESTCRLCHSQERTGAMLKYGVRHYAHAECALQRYGASFFDRLHLWQLENFPALVAARHGLLDTLEQRIKARRRSEA